jgi:hypothetical protein
MAAYLVSLALAAIVLPIAGAGASILLQAM